jgi:hypothetical protein
MMHRWIGAVLLTTILVVALALLLPAHQGLDFEPGE